MPPTVCVWNILVTIFGRRIESRMWVDGMEACKRECVDATVPKLLAPRPFFAHRGNVSW